MMLSACASPKEHAVPSSDENASGVTLPELHGRHQIGRASLPEARASPSCGAYQLSWYDVTIANRDERGAHVAIAERRSVESRKPRIRQVPAVSRALAILRLLGNSAEPMGMKKIATPLSLVPSTCLHILRVLVAEELVKVDMDTKRYSLGSGMLSLARSVIERSGFATLVQPALDRLAQNWSVTTAGVEVEKNKEMILLAISRSRLPFALHIDVGLRFPCLASASGRLVGAYWEDGLPELKRRFKSLKWDRPVDFATWMKEAELSRKKPLFNVAGSIAHTLVAMGLSDQLDARRLAGLAGAMQEEATYLSTLILPKG